MLYLRLEENKATIEDIEGFFYAVPNVYYFTDHDVCKYHRIYSKTHEVSLSLNASIIKIKLGGLNTLDDNDLEKISTMIRKVLNME